MTDQLPVAQQRTWAISAHVIAGVAMILSAGTLGFVAALVIYLVYKDRGPFVRQYAAINASQGEPHWSPWTIRFVR